MAGSADSASASYPPNGCDATGCRRALRRGAAPILVSVAAVLAEPAGGLAARLAHAGQCRRRQLDLKIGSGPSAVTAIALY